MYTKISKFVEFLVFRLQTFRSRNYKSSDIFDCIHMYYEIVRDLVDAKSITHVKLMFIDIEVFEKKFKNKVPDDLYYERLYSLRHIQDEEFTKRLKGERLTSRFMTFSPLGTLNKCKA